MKLPRHVFIKARGEAHRIGNGRKAVIVIEATCAPHGTPWDVFGTPVTITFNPPPARWRAVGITGVLTGQCSHCGRSITNRDIVDWAPMPLVTS